MRDDARSQRTRRTRVARAIAIALAVSLLGSAGFVATFLIRPVRPLEGVGLALATGGLGVALILWSRHLLPQGPHVEEAEPLTPPAQEREAFVEELETGERPLLRRRLLIRLLGAAAAGLGLAGLMPLRTLAPSVSEALVQTRWRAGVRLVDDRGEPVHVDALEPGGVLTVFPEGHTDAADSQTVLIRLRPGQLRRAGEASTPQGYVAYSRVCTHAGCPVGLYEQETSFLYCPCHQSVFDVLDHARPLAGPATRPLPELPIGVDAQGFLRARDDFPEPVGPAWWDMPT